MSSELRLEGRLAGAVRATARLLDGEPLDAIYIAVVYLGSMLVRSVEEDRKSLLEVREELREMMACFESCSIEGVGLIGELDDLCSDSESGDRVH